MTLTAYLMSRLLFLLDAFISFHFPFLSMRVFIICLYFSKAAFSWLSNKMFELEFELCIWCIWGPLLHVSKVFYYIHPKPSAKCTQCPLLHLFKAIYLMYLRPSTTCIWSALLHVRPSTTCIWGALLHVRPSTTCIWDRLLPVSEVLYYM